MNDSKFANIVDLSRTLKSAIAWQRSGDKLHVQRELKVLLAWAENPVAIQQLRDLIAELEQNSEQQ